MTPRQHRSVTSFSAFHFRAFLPPAYVVRREGTVFTGACLSTGGGAGTPSSSHNTSIRPMSFLEGYPFPSHNTSTGPMSFLEGTPFPTHNTSTGPRSLPGGYPSPRKGGGTSVPGGGVPQSQGVPQDRVPQASSGWGTPSQVRVGYPLPQDRTAN